MDQTSLSHQPPNALQPFDGNSRTHDDDQITELVRSMEEFGFTAPILVDESNQILAGHGRLMAAKQLGLSTVPTVVLTGLTEAQKRAYVIADNKLALNASWDEMQLKIELGALQDQGFDIQLTGFSPKDLERYTEEPEALDIRDVDSTEHLLIIQCDGEEQQRELYTEFQERKFSVRIME